MNKEKNKLIKNFNFSKWCFIVIAILAFTSIVCALVTGELSMFSFVSSKVEVIVCSLIFAFLLDCVDINIDGEQGNETER